MRTTSSESDRLHEERAQNSQRRLTYGRRLYETDYERFSRAMRMAMRCVMFVRMPGGRLQAREVNFS